MTSNPLLQVCDLTVTFHTGRMRGASGRDQFKAVNDVSLNLEPGETLALVGESGSGKSTLARAILGLIRPYAGTVRFDGIDVHRASKTERNRLHRGMQLVFQDTGGSLNPRMTVGASIAEPLVIQHKARGAPLRGKVGELLEVVGLRGLDAHRYPHEFSGGQRQRVCIARALALSPRLIVCDEPVSALDVSVQAQILNLLNRLQCDSGLAYLFITHDLRLVRHFSDRMAVMCQGAIVESGPTGEVMVAPQHEYTRNLLASVPSLIPRRAPETVA